MPVADQVHLERQADDLLAKAKWEAGELRKQAAMHRRRAKGDW